MTKKKQAQQRKKLVINSGLENYFPACKYDEIQNAKRLLHFGQHLFHPEKRENRRDYEAKTFENLGDWCLWLRRRKHSYPEGGGNRPSGKLRSNDIIFYSPSDLAAVWVSADRRIQDQQTSQMGGLDHRRHGDHQLRWNAPAAWSITMWGSPTNARFALNI